MLWQSNLYLNILLGFIVVALGATLYILRHKRESYNRIGILFLFFLLEWMVSDYFRLSFTVYSLKIWFLKFSYIGVVSVPILWFLFALSYTNRERYITARNISILSAVPIAALVLAFTNEYHSLFWRNIYINPLEPFMMAENYGIAFWIFLIYLAFFTFFGVFLIVKNIFKKKYYYQWQGILVIFVAMSPLFLSLLDIFDIKPFSNFNTIPLSITIAIVASIFALDKTRKAMIIPIGTDKVLESMEDGVIILDANNRIIDINDSTEKIFKINGKEMVGKDSKILFPDLDFDKVLAESHLKN